MLNGQSVLAVVPCRLGSKRCPRKNFRPFRGVVLYEWSVRAAEKSKYIDKILVSFDRDRPPELCTDEASSEDVLRFHLKQYPHDWVVLLQPTSPLRSAWDIDACIEIAKVGRACISYCNGKKNGAVYVADADWIRKYNFLAPTLMYHMPPERSLDINEASDFLV